MTQLSARIVGQLRVLKASADLAAEALADSPGAFASASDYAADMALVLLVDQCRRAIDERVTRWSMVARIAP